MQHLEDAKALIHGDNAFDDADTLLFDTSYFLRLVAILLFSHHHLTLFSCFYFFLSFYQINACFKVEQMNVKTYAKIYSFYIK